MLDDTRVDQNLSASSSDGVHPRKFECTCEEDSKFTSSHEQLQVMSLTRVLSEYVAVSVSLNDMLQQIRRCHDLLEFEAQYPRAERPPFYHESVIFISPIYTKRRSFVLIDDSWLIFHL